MSAPVSGELNRLGGQMVVKRYKITLPLTTTTRCIVKLVMNVPKPYRPGSYMSTYGSSIAINKGVGRD